MCKISIVLGAMLFDFIASSAEPSYGGKALSEWLVELNVRPTPEMVFVETEKKQQAGIDFETIYTKKQNRDAEAIRQIGTNAIATLLDMLGATQHSAKQIVSKLQSKDLRERYEHDDTKVEDLRALAVDGFAILGTNAEPAIPAITSLFRSFSEPSFQAAQVLTKVGPKGFSALTNALDDSDESIRGNLIWALGNEGGADTNAITKILLVFLKDRSWANRGNAAKFLANRDGNIVIPALLPLLNDDTNFYVVDNAALALSSYGVAARSAAPKIYSIYTNNVVLRDRQAAATWGVTLMWALKAIDIDTAAKAEAFLINSGPLNYARFGYTSVSLKNGQELIAGGYIHTEIPVVTNQNLSTAQLIDPVTGTWAETGMLHHARYSHTATLLRNGTVLVVGGSSGSGQAIASSELYNPKNGEWTETGSLNVARYYHTATLQTDGKVLVAGGHNGRTPLSLKELYDPVTGKWSLLNQK